MVPILALILIFSMYLIAKIFASSFVWPMQKEYRKTNGKQNQYRLTMGLCKARTDSWLIVDDHYLTEHQVKSNLLKGKKERLFCCSTSSEAACEEALEVIVDYLTKTYPQSFRIYSQSPHGEYVEIVETGELFRTRAPFGETMPLEIAARLAMEDFNILMKDDDDQHILRASATCYPVGWSVNSRIDWPIHKIHGPVPNWQDMLRRPVEHFLSKVNTQSTLERSARFVQVADLQSDLADILCQPEPLDYDKKPTGPQQVIVRCERQTFKRLPKTGAILFAVKTTLRPLTDLGITEIRTFKEEAERWPDDIARYKGRDCWGECAFRYCEEVLLRTLPEST